MTKAAARAEEAIVAYREAYQQANGREFPYCLTYERGWIVFRTTTGRLFDRFRIKEVGAMTGRLLARPPAEVSARPLALTGEG